MKKNKNTPKNETDKKPEIGGSPPKPVEQPKPVNDNRVSFSYRDLVLIESFTIENRMYLTFFVANNNPCFIDVALSEYLEYQLAYFRMFEQGSEEGCTCDICIPPFDETGDELSMLIPQEGKEPKEEMFPLYFIPFMVENLIVGLHKDNEHKQDNNPTDKK